MKGCIRGYLEIKKINTHVVKTDYMGSFVILRDIKYICLDVYCKYTQRSKKIGEFIHIKQKMSACIYNTHCIIKEILKSILI